LDFQNRAMTPLPKRILERMLKVKSSFNFWTKAT